MRGEIRFVSRDWKAFRDHLLRDENEHAAFLQCGVGRTSFGPSLLVQEVIPLEHTDYLTRDALSLQISPEATARVAKRAREAGTTLILAHSHPFGGDVRASPLDLETEGDLCGRVLARMLSPLPVGALIIGPEGFDGRLWTLDGPTGVESLRVVGDTVTVFERAASAAEPEATFDRQVRMWGKGGQERLRRSRVVVVGAGGTGCHVAIQLAHLGIGALRLVDHDTVDVSNISRLLGAAPADVGRSKVEVLAEACQSVRPDLEIETVEASVLDGQADWFTDADALVAATDSHGSRALLTQVCQQYLVPVVELGVEVQPGSPLRAGGGVRVLRPGNWCLHCAETLDYALVRQEYLSADERKAEIRRGYLRGSAEPAPSVVALNGVVASLAVLELCHLLTGVLGKAAHRLVYRGQERALGNVTPRQDPNCHICGHAGVRGQGDSLKLPFRHENQPIPQTVG